jgi:ferredoxin
MKVVVDFDVCASTGTCTNVAKEIFELRADGYLYILNDYDTKLPDALTGKAQEAADLCPTGAISIEPSGDAEAEPA